MRSSASVSWLPLSLFVIGVFATACGSSAAPGNRGTGGSSGNGPGSGGASASGGSPGVAGHNGSGGGSAGAPADGSGGSSGTGGRATTGSGGSGRPDGGGCICTAIYAPVCGANGVTYGNSCEAQCVGTSIAHQGACTDGGVDASGGRGSCNHDSDCVFQRTDSCCGSCLAVGDVPAPPTSVCVGACAIQPGGCSCVNHQCARGVLSQGAACSQQQDACGNGLKCCRPCAVPPPVDGGTDSCNPPVCAMVQFVGSTLSCPLIP